VGGFDVVALKKWCRNYWVDWNSLNEALEGQMGVGRFKVV